MTAINRIRIMAGIFIFSGLGTAWPTINELSAVTVTFGTGILSLLVGICLLWHRPLARKIAMFLSVFGAMFVVGIGTAVMGGASSNVMWFDTLLFGAERLALVMFTMAFFLLLYGGMFWVLRTEDVKAMFERPEPAAMATE